MQVRVIIDTRERSMVIPEELAAHGIEIEYATVPAGDYIVSDRACIERKSAGDFESSIMNSRLFDQLARLRESFAKPMLLIESTEDFRLNKNAITGAVLRAYLEYGVQVIFSNSQEETAELIEKIARMEQADSMHEPRLVGIKKAYSTYQWQLLILESIPGIGPKLAHALLRHFKSVRGVINAGPEQLVTVDKIGKKKAMRIEEVLAAEYEEKEDIK